MASYYSETLNVAFAVYSTVENTLQILPTEFSLTGTINSTSNVLSAPTGTLASLTNMYDVLILPFEGTQGSTDIVDEAQGLEPAVLTDAYIDTTQFYAGTSSLLMTGNSYLEFSPFFVGSQSVFTYYIRFSGTDQMVWLYCGDPEDQYLSIVCLIDDPGGIVVEVLAANSEFVDTSGEYPFVADTWYKISVVVRQHYVTVLVDDVLQFYLNFTIANIFSVLVNLMFMSGVDNVWLDSVTVNSSPAPAVFIESLSGDVAFDADIEGIHVYHASNDCSVDLPLLEIDGIIDARIDGDFEVPLIEISGETGSTGLVDFILPEVTGSFDIVGVIDGEIDFPLPQVEGYVITGIICSGSVTCPAMAIVATAYTELTLDGEFSLPVLDLYGIATNLAVIETVFPVGYETGEIYDETPEVVGACYTVEMTKFYITQYSNFVFDSICVFNNKTLCGGADGIFIHEGDDDNGDDIVAYVDLPSVDYGLKNQKSFNKIFVEGYSAGNLAVTAITDGIVRHAYKIFSLPSEKEMQYVFPMNRSGRGNLLGVRIANVNGADFVVNSIYASITVGETLPKGYTILGRGRFAITMIGVVASAS